MSPGETLFVAALAAAGGVAGVVWTGAALSARTVGQPPPGGLTDALRAIPGLARTPGDPAVAWTGDGLRAPLLPTAGVYWAATAAVFVAAVLLLLVLRSLWRSIRSTQRRRLGVDADARFATRRELRPLLVRRPVAGRFVVGAWGRWLVATESRRWAPGPTGPVGRMWGRLVGSRRRGRDGDVTSVAIVGPTRSGKTAECAIPGVLDWEGPAILLSVKRDLMDTTIARRRTLGEVRVFDPGGYLAQNRNSDVTVGDDELARWSPLRNADTATGAKRAGEALAAWTPRAGVDGGMDFWTTQGKLLFTGLLGAAALSEQRSMRAVAEWVFNMTMPDPDNPAHQCEPEDILRRAIDDPDTRGAASAATMHLAAIWNKPDDRIKASVYSTAVTVCDPWLDPNVIAATDLDPNSDGAWVDLDWLMDTGDDGTQVNTLYLVVSNDDYKRLSPVLAGLLSDLKSQAYLWEMQGRRLPAPLLMLIDEAGNMPLEWLPEVSSTCAGIGIQLVTVWQSLAQIHESYGRRADILLTNHATKLFFPGASDDSTLKYQTSIAGDERVEQHSWTSDLTAGNGRRSTTASTAREALVPYHLARLPEFGQALMIHSNTPPAQISGRQWWKQPRLSRLASGQQHRRPVHGPGPWTPTPPTPGRAEAAPAADADDDDAARLVTLSDGTVVDRETGGLVHTHDDDEEMSR